MTNVLSTNKYTALPPSIKYLRVPISYLLDPSISINAAVILSLFKFRNQLSLDNHELYKGTPKDRYFNKKGGYVFIRYMMKELLNILRGTGKKAIRNGIKNLDKANYLNVDTPKHSWKRKNEYHILKKAYDPCHYAMSPKGTLQDTQKRNVSINNTPITNTRLSIDTKSVDTQQPAKPEKPISETDKQLKIAKLNAQTAHDKTKAAKYTYRHKYHLQDIKHKQDTKFTERLSKNTAKTIHLPDLVKTVKEWSFSSNEFYHYFHLIYQGKKYAREAFRFQKGMNSNDYKYLNWGLQFEINDNYKFHDFAKKIGDVITYTNRMNPNKIKKTKDAYMAGWFKKIFMKYAREFNNTHNSIRVHALHKAPTIPLNAMSNF